AQLRSRHAGAAEEDAGIDFDHRAARRRQRVHRPDRDLAVEPVEQAHAGEARFGDLRGADRVIGRGGLAAALGVEALVALAEMHEAGLHPVGDAEIEMAAVGDFEEARGAEVLVVAQRVDIGPELARGARYAGLTGQIGAALDDRRGEAEVEPEQGRLPGGSLEQPRKHLLARPDVLRPDQPRRAVAARFGDRDAFMAPPLRTGPVDGNEGLKVPRHRSSLAEGWGGGPSNEDS